MDYALILKAVLPVVCMLLLGMLARRTRLLSQAGADGLQALVMNVTLPAVVFLALADAEYTPSLWLLAGMMFLCAVAAWGLGNLLRRRMKDAPALLPHLTSGFEAGMLGYALYTILYGADNLIYMAVMDVGQMMFVFTLYLASLNAALGVKKPLADNLRDMVKTPVVDAALLGLILGASGWGKALLGTPAGAAVGETLSFIGGPTGAVILFVVGYGLDLKSEKPRGVMKVCLSRWAITAALCAAMLAAQNWLFPANRALFAATTLEFMLPAPYLLALIVREPRARVLVSSVISVTTLFTIVVFAVLAVAKGII